MDETKKHKRSSQVIFGQFTIAATAHFGVLAILPIFLTSQSTLEKSAVATLLFLASVMGKLGRLVVSSFIDRLPSRSILIVASVVGAIVLLSVPKLDSAVTICIAITIYNLSNGANSISVRSLIANMKQETESRFLKFSKLSVMTNIAATAGPPVAFYMLTTAGSLSPFVFFSLLLTSSAIILFYFRNYIPDLHPQSNMVSGIAFCLKLPGFRRLLVCIIAGYFSYALMYSSVALYATYHLGLKEWGGILLGLNALIVIATTYPLNQWMERIECGHGTRIGIGFFLYLIAFILPLLHKHPITLIAAVVLWAMAETCMLPSLIGLATHNVPESKHIAALTVYSVVVGIGEGLGAAAAVSLTAGSELGGCAGFLLAASVCTVMLLFSRQFFKGMN